MTILFDVIALLALGLSIFNSIRKEEAVKASDSILIADTSVQPLTPEVSATGHQRTVRRHFARGR
jgi:hypothetical protein